MSVPSPAGGPAVEYDDPAAATFPLWGGYATVLVTDPGALEAAVAVVLDTVAEIDKAASLYRPDSHLARVNAASGRPVVVPPTLMALVNASLRAASITAGAVDPTVGSATDPGLAHTSAPRRRGSWRDVAVDDTVRTVRIPDGVRLDLGATAKAWAADQAAARAGAALPGVGILVSLAGDLATAGPAPADGWRVRVTDDHRSDPSDTGVPGVTVAITSGGLATSSVTVRRRSTPTGTAAHIVDPVTLVPVRSRWRTVSVAAGCCLDANTASTAAIVLGAEAPAFLDRFGLPARLVRQDGSAVVVGGWPDDAPQAVAS